MLVETAFVLPVFLLLAFGFFSFSFALMGYLSATNAARIGARYGALHSVSSGSPVTVAQIQAVVQANLFTPGAIGNPAILVYYGDRNQGVGGNYTGDLLGVGVVWGQNIQIPFRGPQTIYITAEAYRIITREHCRSGDLARTRPCGRPTSFLLSGDTPLRLLRVRRPLRIWK
jgi:hypothetical protein